MLSYLVYQAIYIQYIAICDLCKVKEMAIDEKNANLVLHFFENALKLIKGNFEDKKTMFA